MSRRKASHGKFQIRPGFNIGSIVAEQDNLLEDCFIDNTAFESIFDIDDPRCGVVGRAGTGKTAILHELRKRVSQSIQIDPEALAFQFLGSSDMIKALRASNIALDYFYKLLWRHVFVVEILKQHFPDETKRYSLISQVIDHLKKTARPDKERDRAINYLDQWGATILQAPEERVKTIHDTFSKNIKAKIGWVGPWPDLLGLTGGAEGEAQKTKSTTETIRLVKEEISRIQIQDLNAVRQYISTEILTDPQKPCYITIDDLDRFWLEDPLVYELIRALILEIYDWSDVHNLKIVYVIRDNILRKVESEFTSRSYQREKLEAQRTRLHWNKSQLEQIVDKRLSVQAQRMGFSPIPKISDLLPKKTSKRPSGKDYVFERSFLRPRDIIDFFNKAFEQAVHNTAISFKNILDAEPSYSRSRLDAIHDEWRDNCPGIEVITGMLIRGPKRFQKNWITENDIVLAFADAKMPTNGWLCELCKSFTSQYAVNSNAALSQCRRQIIKFLYEIGILGIILPGSGSTEYSYQGRAVLNDNDFETDFELCIHPMFHRALQLPNSGE